MCRLYTYFKYHTAKSRQAGRSHYIYHSYRARHDCGIWSICCHVPVLMWNPFQVFFFQFTKGILHHLHTGGKDTMNLHKKDQFVIIPHLLHAGIFKGTLDIMKSEENGGGLLMILCSINMFLCLIKLSFQWIQRAEKRKKKRKKIKQIKAKGLDDWWPYFRLVKACISLQ